MTLKTVGLHVCTPFCLMSISGHRLSLYPLVIVFLAFYIDLLINHWYTVNNNCYLKKGPKYPLWRKNADLSLDMMYSCWQCMCISLMLKGKLLLFSCSIMSNSFWPQTAACQASLSLTISQSLLKLMFIASMMPSNHLFFWSPLLLLPSIFPRIRDFPNESSIHIRWPKSCSFSLSPSSEYSVLISLKIDWFDIFAI